MDVAEPGPTLMVKTHALGDVLMTSPAIRAFRECWPRERLHYMTGRWSAPVLAENPHLDRVLTVEDAALHGRSPGAIWSLWKQVRAGGYRTALLLQPSAAVRWVVASAGVRRRIGLAHGPSRLLSRSVPWDPLGERPAVEQFLDVVRALGVRAGAGRPEIFLTPAERQQAEDEIRRAGLRKDRLVLLFPGGGRNPRDTVLAKRWPAEGFARVAEALEADGWELVVAGGPGDEEAADRTVELAGRAARRLPGMPDIRGLAAWIHAARLIVTNDSAPLHLGAATGTPTVGIFGPSKPESLVPRGLPIEVVSTPASCAPCYANMPFPGCLHPPAGCMEAIPSEAVVDAARRLLREDGARELAP